MGMSEEISLFVGFAVPDDKLYDISYKDNFSCDHLKLKPQKANGGEHCSDCGVKFKIWSSRIIDVKPAMHKFAGDGVDDLYNGKWTSTVAGRSIMLRRLVNNYYGGETIFVGEWFVTDINSGESSHFIGEPGDMISETKLASALKKAGVPFDRNSFGIYMLKEMF